MPIDTSVALHISPHIGSGPRSFPLILLIAAYESLSKVRETSAYDADA